MHPIPPPRPPFHVVVDMVGLEVGRGGWSFKAHQELCAGQGRW